MASGAAAIGSACGLDGRAVGLAGASGSGGGGTSSSSGGAGGSGSEDGRAGAGGSGVAGASEVGVVGASEVGVAGGLGGGIDRDAGSDSGPEPELPFCAAQAIAGLGSVTAATTGDEGQFALSCAQGSADDVGFYWVAPEAGYYSIDTFGSSFDTALAVVPESCTGELACSDDAGGGITSEIVREFAAGEAVVFVVDGEGGSTGSVVLNTHAITCPGIDLNRQQPPLDTTTLDGTNQHAGACGGDGELEKAFRWRAPSAGLYRFTAASDDFSPALYVERGARCGGELIGCNAGGFGSPATALARLAQGEVATLIVDGVEGAGDVQLNVEDVTGQTCPNQVGFSPFDEVSGTLTGGDPSVLTGSCVPARQIILPGGAYDLPEHSYPISVDGASCDVLITADGPVAIYVQEGLQCGGRELACDVVEDASQGEFVQTDLGNLTGPSADYVVTVEAIDPNGPPVNYTLGFACAVI